MFFVLALMHALNERKKKSLIFWSNYSALDFQIHFSYRNFVFALSSEKGIKDGSLFSKTHISTQAETDGLSAVFLRGTLIFIDMLNVM